MISTSNYIILYYIILCYIILLYYHIDDFLLQGIQDLPLHDQATSRAIPSALATGSCDSGDQRAEWVDVTTRTATNLYEGEHALYSKITVWLCMHFI